jgi:alpha-glutamyl/putrescinyl thymine pyrophosphorylase-like protein
MFCRHNRLTSKCPICSRELEDNLRSKAPVRHVTPRKTGSSSTPRARSASPRSSGRLVTRQLARAADDGYRNPLVPGLRATADAERLAVALTDAAARLEPPGPYPLLADVADLEQATWLAFLFALAPDLQPLLAEANPAWEDADVSALPESKARTAAAYRAWVQRAGSQEAALTGDASWSPERRFGRVFERLTLPGFNRAARYDLLTALGAAGRYPLEADAVHFVEDDATTLAAKRMLVSGDRMLLERRARDLAEACDLPVAALDRGLAVWGTPGEHVDLAADPAPGVAAALGLH